MDARIVRIDGERHSDIISHMYKVSSVKTDGGKGVINGEMMGCRVFHRLRSPRMTPSDTAGFIKRAVSLGQAGVERPE